MQSIDNALRQLTTTSAEQSQKQISSDRIDSLLQAKGYDKAIAGEDYNAVLRGVTKMVNDQYNRGLLLVGNPGVGKTFLMKVLWRFPSKLERFWVNCADMEEVKRMLSTDTKYYKVIGSNQWNSNFFIDDFGADTIKSEYGNRIDIVGSFIEAYHRKGRGRLIISTNLHSNKVRPEDNNGILEIYGARILDRIREKTIVIPFKGQSKRKKETVW